MKSRYFCILPFFILIGLSYHHTPGLSIESVGTGVLRSSCHLPPAAPLWKSLIHYSWGVNGLGTLEETEHLSLITSLIINCLVLYNVYPQLIHNYRHVFSLSIGMWGNLLRLLGVKEKTIFSVFFSRGNQQTLFLKKIAFQWPYSYF